MRTTRTHLLLALLAAACCAAPSHSASLTQEQRDASIRYVRSLQNPDGGFRSASADGPSTVANTTSGLRALAYLGDQGSQRKAGAFVSRCGDGAGGIMDTPGGTADVRSTALGLMALAEVYGGKLKSFPDVQPVVTYLEKNAHAMPDLYIAAAALDAAGLKTGKAAEWMAAFEATRNADGSYGKGPADTAGAVITTLRLGGTVKDPAAAARALKAAQRPDGGFAAMGDASDLSSTYRVMRALRMLNERPDLTRLREFIGRCRNSDGGYGVSPGKASGVAPTYNAAIVLRWADELEK